MPKFRRGTEAITQAQERSASGSKFSPFVPSINWKDGDEKFLLFLNPADEIPTVDLHEWIPVGEGTSNSGKSWTRYEQFIARTDPAIGEEYDDLTDRLQNRARARTLAVAVELDPTFEMVKGRKRPNGFEVKTDTYIRKVDGGTEEVTRPVIGLVTQSPSNFFNWIGSFNESTAPIEETPVSVTRVGGDASTKYNFVPYLDQTVDLTNLLELIDGVSYLADELEEIHDAIERLSPQEAATQIATLLLEKRLTELADEERYIELVKPIEVLEQRFSNNSSSTTSTSTRKVTTGMGNPRRLTNTSKFETLRNLADK